MPDIQDTHDVGANPPTMFYDVLRAWATQTPEAPAFLAESGVPLTFKALVSTIDEIGASLNACGFGRNDRIAIIHPGGADLATAIAGIWSHATAVPLSPHLGPGELAVYLRDLRIDAIAITAGSESPARIVAERLGLPILDLTRKPAMGAGHIQLSGPPIPRPTFSGRSEREDVALVLMTSGTTAESKIVPIRHSQFVDRSHDGARLLALTAADRGVILMQLFHWGGIGSILYPLYAGGSAAYFPDNDLRHVFHCLEALEPSYIAGPFTIFHAILAQQERLGDSIRKIRPKLRMLRTGAGHLDPNVAAHLESLFDVPVIQAYGSSETAFMACEPFPPMQRKAGSVGLLGSSRLAIIDENGNRLPAHSEGEIIVSGPKVFDGYENNPEANAASFIDGWFRIGDLGYFDEDGFLFLTGRTKEIINRGGQKITPGEIDAAIMAHPTVDFAIAFPVPHPTLGDDIAAAVVLKPDMALSENALSAYLRSRLGAAKVPRQILFVDTVPKGDTGKIQRYKLAAAFGLDDTARRSAENGCKATPTEVILGKIWAETLRLPAVPLNGDFFALGGDSLLAVELFLRIEEQIGRRLPRSVLFEANTVAEMAKHIESSLPTGSLVPIQPAGSRPIFYCVHDLNGQVLNFRTLARHLGTDQPFYGIQMIGLSNAETPLARIEDMAARYVAEIRRLQPVGPYYLGGYSMGGLVAYEMAQQLRAAGQSVGMLGLLDTYPRQTRGRTRPSDWFIPTANRPSDQTPSSVSHYLASRCRAIALNARTFLWRRLFGAAWRLCEAVGADIPKRLRRPIAANLLAIRSYRIKPYHGDAVQFKALPYVWDRNNVRDDWRHLIRGNLEIQQISGLHHEILAEPHVRVLARKLTDYMSERLARRHRELGDATVTGQD